MLKKSLTRNQNTQLLLSNHSRVRPVEFWRSTLLTHKKKNRRAVRAPNVPLPDAEFDRRVTTEFF